MMTPIICSSEFNVFWFLKYVPIFFKSVSGVVSVSAPVGFQRLPLIGQNSCEPLLCFGEKSDISENGAPPCRAALVHTVVIRSTKLVSFLALVSATTQK